MAHFAKLNADNIVEFVTVGRDEDDGKELELSKRTGHTYKQTSYNTHAGVHYNAATGKKTKNQSKAFRKNYAGIGFTYDERLNAFIPPKPFDSWKLDEMTCLWVAPISVPDDGSLYTWDEASKTWTKIVE